MNNETIDPSILNLLSFTKAHLHHRETLMRATGSHFNLFQVLGIGHYEVKTHSPILAELLNPKGRHCQGEVFLKLFLENINIEADEFEAKSSTVKTEYHLGTKTEDAGGRIDIVIEDSRHRRILIENKIYASDQEKQLSRYRKFDDNAYLFYLTLYGNPPLNLTEEEMNKTKSKCISYKDHIHAWLIDCRKEVACLPSIREMLSQYIALIEELTHQSTTIQMNKNLINEIIDKPDNLHAFFTLRDAESAVQESLVNRLDAALDEHPDLSDKLKKEEPLKKLSSRYRGFGYTSDHMDQLNLRIRFEFQKPEYSHFIFGFRILRDREECYVKSKLGKLFQEEFSSFKMLSTEAWPAHANFESPYFHWEHRAFEDIHSGKFVQIVIDKIHKLNHIAGQISK